MNNFNLKKFLIENKLTNNSRILSETSVEGIDLNVVKDLQKEPAVQKLHKQFTNNPELAREAAKVLANIVDGSISENINETFTPEEIKFAEEYGFSPEEIEFANKKGVVRSKFSSDQGYADQIFWVNDKYNPAMTTGPYDKSPKPVKKDSTLTQVLRSAGAGAALIAAMAPLTIAGTTGFAAAGAGTAFVGAILLGALLGIGAGAVTTNGFTTNSVVEESTDLAGEAQAIIDAGRKL